MNANAVYGHCDCDGSGTCLYCKTLALPIAELDTWRVYLLRCSDGTLYCGVAKNLLKRLVQHNSGRGSKYVRSRRPFMVEWTEIVLGWSAALRREAEIKRMTRAQKLVLIASAGST